MISQDVLEQLQLDLNLGKVFFASSLPSTNITAAKWLEEGCPNYSLVVADEQSSGKGRSGRKWHTNPGSALAFSLIVTKTALPITHYAGFSAVSVTQALSSFTSSEIQIKWPNDILLKGKKICGILTETVWSGNSPTGVIMGIGVNIFKTSLEIDEALRYPATWLQNHSDAPVSRVNVLQRILEQIIANHTEFKWPELHTVWNQHLAYKGQKIRAIRQEDEEITGTLVGVVATGELEISLADSRTVLYNANEIQRITPS
jgi:BirA family biotin operon repressor/biotin-[acetyl-CoA-carboxylase] ligase